jgi:hypothetical protein
VAAPVPMVPEVARALARLLDWERFAGDDDPLANRCRVVRIERADLYAGGFT